MLILLIILGPVPKKTPQGQPKAPLLPIPVRGPFDSMAVDCFILISSISFLQQIYSVFSAYRTRWPEAFPAPNVEASTIAELLVDEILA